MGAVLGKQLVTAKGTPGPPAHFNATYLSILHVSIRSHERGQLGSSHRGRQALDMQGPQ
jgi:hypothetical protein